MTSSKNNLDTGNVRPGTVMTGVPFPMYAAILSALGRFRSSWLSKCTVGDAETMGKEERKQTYSTVADIRMTLEKDGRQRDRVSRMSNPRYLCTGNGLFSQKRKHLLQVFANGEDRLENDKQEIRVDRSLVDLVNNQMRRLGKGIDTFEHSEHDSCRGVDDPAGGRDSRVQSNRVAYK